ncbi:uncharacterized protein BN460_01570 [Porphyromonas sp. CAG:1061]|nr:uncharacterized protein BN460_01570 [Porphyromonas sp. CAG:1061]
MVAHRFDKGRYQAVHKGLVLVEECIGIPHRSTKDTPNHIACLGITWQLPISNTKSNRADVVGNHPHSDIPLLILTIFTLRQLCNLINQWGKDIGIIITHLALQSHTEALQAHTSINHLIRQTYQRAIGLAIVLHKDKVPNLHHLWVVTIHQALTIYLGTLLIATQVNMNFGARTTWSCLTHLPKIIVLIAINDALL